LSLNIDELEVVPGFEHQNLQGQIFDLASEADLRDALEKAFDYRGDVTITLKTGATVEGYIFDRRLGATLSESTVRLFPKNNPTKLSIAWSDIAGLAFTGRDTAAGKTWEAWLKKYWEKKQAGEKNIELKPESLD
jgi:hypothetical protein